MNFGIDEQEVLGLARHCAPSVAARDMERWSIGELNLELSCRLEDGWRSVEQSAQWSQLEMRPPEYSLESSIVGRFAVIGCPRLHGYLAVCLPRGLEGDVVLPPLLLPSPLLLAPLAWDVGMAFAMSPSRRAEAAAAVFAKRASHRMGSPILLARRRSVWGHLLSLLRFQK